jgi:hypothetical protein
MVMGWAGALALLSMSLVAVHDAPSHAAAPIAGHAFDFRGLPAGTPIWVGYQDGAFKALSGPAAMAMLDPNVTVSFQECVTSEQTVGVPSGPSPAPPSPKWTCKSSPKPNAMLEDTGIPNVIGVGGVFYTLPGGGQTRTTTTWAISGAKWIVDCTFDDGDVPDTELGLYRVGTGSCAPVTYVGSPGLTTDPWTLSGAESNLYGVQVHYAHTP